MKAAIVITSLLLFATFVASGFYASNNLRNYLDTTPKPPVVGLISAIRNSFFPRLHDPRDSGVSEECLAYLQRAKVGATVAAATWVLIIAFVVAVRTLGLNQYLD
jgi:hypothetical protein